MVLHELVRDKVTELSSAAVVSCEWQAFIEPHTFANIRLTTPRMAKLNDMTKRNRALVRSLWLCIELEEYDCSECDHAHLANNAHTRRGDNNIIIAALRAFFESLSVWEPNRNLTLDISLYSNSDKEHYFKYLTFEPDTPNQVVTDDSAKSIGGNKLREDERHRWVTSESGPLVPQHGALERVFAHVLNSPKGRREVRPVALGNRTR